MLRRFFLVACFAIFGAVSASAQGVDQFGRVITFGDSLSDPGNAAASGPLYPGTPFAALPRFTTPGGLTWIEHLRPGQEKFGGSIAGDVNWATGGAHANLDPGEPNLVRPGLPNALDSVRNQITTYLGSGGTFGDDDLVTSWAGANDFFQFFALNNATLAGLSPTAAQAMIVNAGVQIATEQVTNVGIIAGAATSAGTTPTIVVPNLPNLGATPDAIANGTQLPGFAASSAYNAALDQGLDVIAAANKGVNIVEADVAALFAAAQADPAAFGLTNVSEACIRIIACATNPAAQSGFLFWDDVHPTDAGHRAIARYVGLLLATDIAAAQTESITQAANQGVMAVTENVFDRAQAWIDGSYARENGFHAEIIATQGDFDAFGNRAASSFGLYGIRTGLDKQFGNALVGASAAILTGDASSSALTSDVMSFQANLYGSMVFGPMYATGVASASFMQFNEIDRRTGLGNIVATGETGSDHYGISGEVGAILKAGGGFAIVPSVRVGYVDGTVDAYTESGPLLALSYAERNTSFSYWSAELRASKAMNFGTVYGEVGYEDFLSYSGDAITAKLVDNTAQAVSTSVDDPVSKGFFVRAGANGRISETMSLDADYSLSLAEGEGEIHTGKIRLKISMNGTPN